MYCLTLGRLILSRRGQASNYFTFFIAQFVTGLQCFLTTPGTTSITVHLKLLCNAISGLEYKLPSRTWLLNIGPSGLPSERPFSNLAK
jgi:hypothetical protein